MEDEEKIGSDEDMEKAEQENQPKKPTNSDLIKDYLEIKEDEEKEERVKAKDKVIEKRTDSSK